MPIKSWHETWPLARAAIASGDSKAVEVFDAMIEERAILIEGRRQMSKDMTASLIEIEILNAKLAACRKALVNAQEAG